MYQICVTVVKNKGLSTDETGLSCGRRGPLLAHCMTLFDHAENPSSGTLLGKETWRAAGPPRRHLGGAIRGPRGVLGEPGRSLGGAWGALGGALGD